MSAYQARSSYKDSKLRMQRYHLLWRASAGPDNDPLQPYLGWPIHGMSLLLAYNMATLMHAQLH